MSICKAIVQQGANKGNQCSYLQAEGNYCKNHFKTFGLLDKAKAEGKEICKNLFRGCKNYAADKKKKCNECLNKDKVKEKTTLDTWRSDLATCIGCGTKPFEPAIGKKDKAVRKCVACFDKEREIEAKRTKVTNLKEYHNTHLQQYITEYKRSAAKRGHIYSLTDDEFATLVVKECYYCCSNKEGEINGIDRVDNKKGYLLENCVPCCEICNKMKKEMKQSEFYYACKAITSFQNDKKVMPITNDSFNKNKMSYDVYKKASIETRKKSFDLSPAEYYSFSSKECYLCGNAPPIGLYNGIDRKDSSVGYKMDNCNPCCNKCNGIKNMYSLEEILSRSSIIAEKYVKPAESKISNNEFKPKLRWRAQEIALEMLKPDFPQFVDKAYPGCDDKFKARLLLISSSSTGRSADELIDAIQKAQLSNRVAKVKASIPLRHKKTATIIAEFDNGKFVEYYEWYCKTYGEDEQLKKMIESMKIEWPITREEDKDWVIKKMVEKFKNKRNH